MRSSGNDDHVYDPEIDKTEKALRKKSKASASNSVDDTQVESEPDLEKVEEPELADESEEEQMAG